MSLNLREKVLKAAALSYKKGMQAPVLLAYGEKVLAEKIVSEAEKNNVVIQKNEVIGLFETLKNMQLRNEIPPELFEIVARIFSFIHLKNKGVI